MLSRLPLEQAERLATRKNNCKKMIADEPSATVLTLPDDLVHYNQSRILTVREMARLQSFDDSFEFLGKTQVVIDVNVKHRNIHWLVMLFRHC